MDTVTFVAGLFFAFLTFVLLGAPGEKQCPRVGMNLALVLPGRRRCLHLHHWMLAAALALLILFVLCLSGGRLTPLLSGILGVCAGTVMSGFMYEDAMDIVQLCSEAQPC
jgi:hypothetical protein